MRDQTAGALTPDARTIPTEEITLTLAPGEAWWGGAVDDAVSMPYESGTDFVRDLGHAHAIDTGGSQSAPLLLSTHGRYVWSDTPFTVTVTEDRLVVRGSGVSVVEAGDTLRDAYRAASRAHFPATGAMPDRAMFTGPQYNTWIENPYRPTQQGVTAYVRGNLAAGLPAGVVMIDDSWNQDYGVWEFDAARFPDPAGMTAELGAWGCDVMLWVVPFVSPDSATFRELERAGLLLRDAHGSVAVRRWWNGLSALLDVTAPAAVAWLRARLDALIADTGVAGFKFDGGDVGFLRDDDRFAGGGAPVDYAEAWATLGDSYAYNEYRACWKRGGTGLAQRLADKPPRWDDTGIGGLVPELLAQGLIGHAFGCPDMVGGGEIDAMTAAGGIDQEFFIRHAQIGALSPMIQFSTSPARVLDAEHQDLLHETLSVRERFLPLILALAETAAQTGEPILRPMGYRDRELGHVRDQFFLGDDVFVAPVIERGAVSRTVQVPAGTWRDQDDRVVVGPTTIDVPVTLATLPRFTRVLREGSTS